jgi:hypothetical protein
LTPLPPPPAIRSRPHAHGKSSWSLPASAVRVLSTPPRCCRRQVSRAATA